MKNYVVIMINNSKISCLNFLHPVADIELQDIFLKWRFFQNLFKKQKLNNRWSRKN